MGAGAYVDSAAGGAAATGDGDVMMRFLPRSDINWVILSLHVVSLTHELLAHHFTL